MGTDAPPASHWSVSNAEQCNAVWKPARRWIICFCMMAHSAFIAWVFHGARDIERIVEGMVTAKLHDAPPFFPLAGSRHPLCEVAREEEHRIQCQ